MNEVYEYPNSVPPPMRRLFLLEDRMKSIEENQSSGGDPAAEYQIPNSYISNAFCQSQNTLVMFGKTELFHPFTKKIVNGGGSGAMNLVGSTPRWYHMYMSGNGGFSGKSAEPEANPYAGSARKDAAGDRYVVSFYHDGATVRHGITVGNRFIYDFADTRLNNVPVNLKAGALTGEVSTATWAPMPMTQSVSIVVETEIVSGTDFKLFVDTTKKANSGVLVCSGKGPLVAHLSDIPIAEDGKLILRLVGAAELNVTVSIQGYIYER